MSLENQFGTDFEKRVAAAVEDIEAEQPAISANRLKRFGDLPLKAKFRLMFGGFVTLTFLIGLIFLASLMTLYSASQDVSRIHSASLTAADLNGNIGEMRYNAVRYIFRREAETLKAVKSSRASMMTDIDQMRSVAGELAPAIVPEIETLEIGLADYEQVFSRLQRSLAKNGQNEVNTKLAHELAADGDAIYSQSREIEDKLVLRAEEIEKAGVDRFVWIIAMLLVLGCALLVILFLAMRFFSRNLSDKIQEVTAGMNELVAGRYDFEIAGGERQDEVGAMIRAMTVFRHGASRLQKFTEEREQMRKQRRKELRQLADGFERNIGEIASGVASASSQLKSTAESMAEMARKSSTKADDVARAAQDASAGAKAAAGAGDEFAMAISEISRQASSSARLARDASENAGLADATISALSSSASQIGDIVDLIQSIAKRTNLLALNASIEASRGGDAGRGFAVVASEIKELAARTSRATEEVSGQIRTIQDSTGNSVSALRSIAGQIQQLEETAVAIASAVDQQSIAGQELARSIDLASRNSDAVSDSILEVREAAIGTGSASAQLLQSADELETQSTTLNTELTEFLARIRTS